jgi:hypothetical protein
METTPWQGNELDKDILGDGRHYSPQTCCFVPKSVNMFWTKCGSRDVGFVGVSLDKTSGKFKAHCKVGRRRKTLGRFSSEHEAHKAWLRGKTESMAILLGSFQLDERIVEGMTRKLKSRFKPAPNPNSDPNPTTTYQPAGERRAKESLWVTHSTADRYWSACKSELRSTQAAWPARSQLT